MKKRITIKDIARELNVHHSTISRALRNDPRVNDKTKELVLAYAQEHGYQINMNAVQLRGSRNNAIALIVPNINHSFFSDIISHLTNLAYDKGYIISVFQTNEKYKQEVEIVNTIIKHNFAGVIVSIAKDTVKSDHFAQLKKFAIPLVFFDRVCEDITTPKVLVNNREITYAATEYLVTKGYKRIVHLTGTNSINVFRERAQGYLGAVLDHHLEYQNCINIEDDFSIEKGKEIFSRLWNSDSKPDAIISSSVNVALGLLLQARAMGVKIPEDCGLITFGNQLSSEVIQPQITYIEQPETEIAQLAFDLLEKQIHNELTPTDPLIKEVKAKIIFKESC